MVGNCSVVRVVGAQNVVVTEDMADMAEFTGGV